MKDMQPSLFEHSSPAAEWDRDAARRALDDLFSLTYQYKSSKGYHELIKFVARFRFDSPFNAMLVHVQMPGASYVAPPHRWLRDYRRRIKPEGRPLAILRPMGRVMFVFDVSDAEPDEDPPSLPPEIERPFEVRQGAIGIELTRTIDNAKWDGVNIAQREPGSQSAGALRVAQPGNQLPVVAGLAPEPGIHIGAAVVRDCAQLQAHQRGKVCNACARASAPVPRPPGHPKPQVAARPAGLA